MVPLILTILALSLLKTSNAVCFNQTYTYEEVCPTYGSLIRVKDEPLGCGIWEDSPLYDCRIIGRVKDALPNEGLFPLPATNDVYCHPLSISVTPLECYTKCGINVDPLFLCKGTTDYCSLRVNNTLPACDNSAVCTCQIMVFFKGFDAFDKNGKKLTNGTIEHVPAYYVDDPSNSHICGDKTYKISLSSDGHVFVQTNQTGKYHCKISKGNVTTIVFNDTAEFQVSEYDLIKTSNLTVECFCRGIVVKTNSKLLLASNKCPHYSFWSKGWFTNISCWEFSDWFYSFFIIALIVSIFFLLKKLWSFPKVKGVAMIALIPFSMLKWFLFVLWNFKNISSTPIVDMAVKKFYSLKSNAYYWFTPNKKDDSIPMTEQKTTPYSSSEKGSTGKIRYVKGNPNAYLSLGLICVLLIVGVPQVESVCFSSSAITGNLTSCVDNNGILSCQVTFSTLINIVDKYSNSCVHIVDNEGHNVMEIEIGAIVSNKVSLESLYYTCPWTFDFKYNLRCNGQTLFTHDVACPDSGCLDVNSNDPKVTVQLPISHVKDEQMNTPAVDYPGYTGCVNIGTHCLLGSTACAYYRYVLKPDLSEYAQVNSVFSNEWELQPTISVSDSNTTGTIPIYKIGKKYYIGADRKASLTVLGSFQASSFFLTEKIVVEKNGKVSLLDALGPNVKGVGLGDYQADSVSDLSVIGKPVFQHESFSMKSIGPDMLKVDYTESSYRSNIHLGKPFPQKINGETYDYKSGYLVSELSNPPTVQMLLQTHQPISVVYKKTEVNPECTFKHASGTSDSAQGSVIILNCKSSIDAGIAYVKPSVSYVEVKTKTILLTKSFTDFNINIATSEVTNSFYLLVQGTLNTQKVYIKFDAPRPDHAANTTNDQKEFVKDKSEETPYSDFGDDLADGFNFGSIKTTLMSFGIVLAVILIVVLIGCFAFKMFARTVSV